MKTLTFDLETVGLDPYAGNIVCIGYKVDNNSTVVAFDSIPKYVKDMLSDPTISKIGHNLPFDIKWLRVHGATVVGPYFDTKIAHAQKHPFKSHKLKDILKTIGWSVTTIDTIIGKGKNQTSVADADRGQLVSYCKQDVDGTYKLYELLRNSVSDWTTNIEFPLIDVVVGMEMTGMAVDVGKLSTLESQLIHNIHQIKSEFPTYVSGPKKAPVTKSIIGSAKRLREWLVSEGYAEEMSKYLTDGGALSTDKTAMKALVKVVPVAKKIVRYRQLSTILKTYVTRFKRGSVLRGGFNQVGTVTGRFSSSNPNMQNIPNHSIEGKRVRECIVARPGHRLIVSDLGQIEPRFLAHYSSDPKMLALFQAGVDFNTKITQTIFKRETYTKEERFVGKTMGLATFYLAGVRTLQNSLLKFDIDMSFYEVSKIRQSIKDAYPHAIKWGQQYWKDVERRGYVQTIGGRRIHEDRTSKKTLSPVNYLMQGSCSDAIKLIMLNASIAGLKVIGSIHDEVIIESREERAQDDLIKLEWIMLNSVRLQNIPLTTDIKICRSWAEAK